jgi:hypothetical protein
MHFAKNLNHDIYVEREPSKNINLKCIYSIHNVQYRQAYGKVNNLLKKSL